MIFKLLVNGRVQGVNFRSMTKSFCAQLGIKGNVKNLDDGRVEIIVQCSGDEKEKLVNWLESSPGSSTPST